MSGERLLIVNADDLGRSPGINAGILKASHEGIVTSTTLMVNLPWTRDAVDRLSGNHRLAIGLHLNFCYGKPVLPPAEVPSLVDRNGYFVTDVPYQSENAAQDEIRAETQAQITAFRILLGKSPTHVDSHKYLHSCPRIRYPVIAVGHREGLAIRTCTDDDRLAARDSALRTTNHFEGRFHGLDGEGVSLAILMAILKNLEAGSTELMCHPGFVDQEICDSSYQTDRQRELEVLCDPLVKACLAECDITLSTFDSI